MKAIVLLRGLLDAIVRSRSNRIILLHHKRNVLSADVLHIDTANINAPIVVVVATTVLSVEHVPSTTAIPITTSAGVASVGVILSFKTLAEKEKLCGNEGYRCSGQTKS